LLSAIPEASEMEGITGTSVGELVVVLLAACGWQLPLIAVRHAIFHKKDFIDKV